MAGDRLGLFEPRDRRMLNDRYLMIIELMIIELMII